MKILKAKVLPPPFIRDADGDWWTAAIYDYRQGELLYELVEDVEDFWFCWRITEYSELFRDRVTDNDIQTLYEIDIKTWDMKLILESLEEDENSQS